MPRLSGGKDGLSDKRRLEWEAAVEAVIRDITTPAPTQQKPPIVQIVIYESSVQKKFQSKTDDRETLWN